MKHRYFLLLLVFNAVYSQTTPFFNYQGVAREKSGLPVVEKSIRLRISIVQDFETGNAIYSEIHQTNTSKLGLFAVKIGLGSIEYGNFSTIDWSSHNYFTRVEIDLNETGFKEIGISQLSSVPYALYAKNSTTSVFKFDKNTGVITHDDGAGKTISAPIISTDADNTLQLGSDGGTYFKFNKSIFSQNIKSGEINFDNGDGKISIANTLSKDADNSIIIGSDGGTYFKFNKSVFSQDLKSGKINFDNGDGKIISANILSKDADNSIKIGGDGGVYFFKTKPEFIQNKSNGTITHNDGEGNINKAKVISSDPNNTLEIGSDGGAFLNLTKIDGKLVQEKNTQKSSAKKCVEVFKQDADSVDDTEIIQNAIDKAGSNNCVCLEPNTTYTITSSLQLKDYQNLSIIGNMSTLKRANSDQTTSKLTKQYSGGNSIEVANPSLFKIGDLISLITSSSGDDIVDERKIISINGNTITLFHAFKKTYGGNSNFPAGTIVGKNYPLIVGLPSSDTSESGNAGSNKHILIKNIIFDGNGTNNTVSDSWTYCATIILHGEGSQITNCKFIDIGNECIVGHGININNNHFDGGDGSAFHTSVNDQTLEDNTPAFFSNNTVENFNRVSNLKSKHSEGTITFSWGAGNLTINNNYFRNDNKKDQTSLLGSFGSGIEGDNLDKNLIFVGNQSFNYSSIFFYLSPSAKNVLINNNIFSNCGNNSFPRLSTNNEVKFCGNIYSDGTIVTIPDNLNCN